MKKTDERTTPQDLFAEFHFDIDVAATPENAKLPRYYTKEDSAFNHTWVGTCFCNPPYSEIYRWLQYATTQPATTVFILPCDTSTRWFHDFLWDDAHHRPRPGVQLRFPKGRFKFGTYTTSPKFATIIAVIQGNGRRP